MLRRYSTFDDDIPKIALKSIFKKYDLNCDGELNKEELTSLMENEFGLSFEQINTYHWILDKDGNGTLSYDEFENWMDSDEQFKCVNDRSRYNLIICAIELFKKYDCNHNRTLDRQEFLQLHSDCGGKPENLSVALKYVDRDGNGVISFYEFLKWLNWVDLGNM